MSRNFLSRYVLKGHSSYANASDQRIRSPFHDLAKPSQTFSQGLDPEPPLTDDRSRAVETRTSSLPSISTRELLKTGLFC
jgi:hypothetical protein